ncbi:MAG: hypothetical protein Tsb0034_14510 [Ekhidna sp.]
MKKSILILLVIIAALVGFVIYTFSSTGYFREINNTEGYQVIASHALKGAEDLTIDYEAGFAIISQDDRAGRRDGNPENGGLFMMDLSLPDFPLKKLNKEMELLLYPHGISMYKLDSGRFMLLVVNHADGESIERFELQGDQLVHLETIKDESMVSINDVVAVDEKRFYFTNDHGYTSKLGLLAENYLGLAVSNVVYFDGVRFEEGADGIAYANGINLSLDRTELLVASPRKFELRYYAILEDGSLRLNKSLAVGSGIDNIEVDPEGNLWMGSHPNLLAFTAYAAGKKEQAPSEIIKVTKSGAVESLFENDGSLISATSVVAPYNDLLIVGTVMDDRLLIIKEEAGSK